MILVVGATGPTGRAATNELVERGHAVRAVTRDPAAAALVPELAGAELVFGDSSRPDTLRDAFEGITKLYFVPPTFPGWDVAEARILELALDASVEHIVRISALGTQPDAESMSLSFHWDGERQLERSGIAYTHVRANSFFQNTLFDAETIRTRSAFYSCVGPLRFAKVDTRDIGAVVATTLTTPGHEGAAYTVTGSQSLSYDDMASILSTVLGREVRYVDMSIADYSAQLIRDGFPTWLADEFAAIYGGFDDPSVVEDVTDTVASVLGRPPRTFGEFVRDHIEQFA
jgi:uncharacterized protein YbjT (DUF2867 family)